MLSLLTILFSAGEDLLAPHSIPSSGKSQHLDAVVGVFFQAIQLQGWLGSSDVFYLSQLYKIK